MKSTNFIRQVIDKDIENGAVKGPVTTRSPPEDAFIISFAIGPMFEESVTPPVTTRFPPEPNGYLHIGHAKSICLNFGIAEDYHGKCNFRFDDTNPSKENIDYVNSIIEDVRWLGYSLNDAPLHASSYFEQLYSFAVELIEQGKAYVDSLSPEQIREYRGTLTEPGKDSPYRNRTIEENLDLFTRMRNGEFKENEHVLRAKIDMSSGNINMRDPALYRIRHESHPITGSDWCIYPLYDMAHGLSDAIEGVTHSLCTMEFEDHRPLYNWLIDNVTAPSKPKQIEFSRLSLEYTVLSKRLLTRIVDEGLVDGWGDPRMPTLAGLRNRGYTPESIRDFCERIGITKNFNEVEMGVLENSARLHLDHVAPRTMAVLNPLKLVVENYPEDKVEWLDAQIHPKRPELGTRKVPFSKTIYIEKDDFMEAPPKKYFRLAPGSEVRLRYAYLITCTSVIKDSSGEITQVNCRIDPDSRGGIAPDGRKVRGTIHWVAESHCQSATVNLYDRLFLVPNPDSYNWEEFGNIINPGSLQVVEDAKVEVDAAQAPAGSRFQFERNGYYCVARPSTENNNAIFHRTVSLRDSWSKIEK